MPYVLRRGDLYHSGRHAANTDDINKARVYKRRIDAINSDTRARYEIVEVRITEVNPE